jgi:hypothetical protein
MMMETKISMTDQEVGTITKTSIIMLESGVDDVFPLFGPIREKEWADGWNPRVLTATQDVSEHMMFRTRSKYTDEPDYTWIISKYHPEQFLIEYTVISSDRIWFITVACKAVGTITEATITYSYNGFTATAIARNRESAEKMFAHSLKDWETAINYFLRTGKKLGGHN